MKIFLTFILLVCVSFLGYSVYVLRDKEKYLDNLEDRYSQLKTSYLNLVDLHSLTLRSIDASCLLKEDLEKMKRECLKECGKGAI